MKKQTHLQYALLAALAVIILGLILHFTGFTFETWVPYVEMIPFAVMVLFNAGAFSKANDHYVTFGNTFGSGFKLTLIVSVIIAIWGVTSLFILPDFKDSFLAKTQQDMVSEGLAAEDIERHMTTTSKYFEVFAAGALFFMYLFWGCIFSLISAAIVKKKGELPSHAGVQ